MFRFACVCLLTFQATQIVALGDDGPAKQIPELKALSHYVGEWDVVTTVKDQPFVKGQAKAEWILDGRFVQQTGVLKSANGDTLLKTTTLMTYDQELKSYRMWLFFSDGQTYESVGQWDEEKKTMTSFERSANRTTTANFSKEGTEQWKIVTKDPQNQVVGELSGTNSRRQK
jgi:hypothetical protein